jgi:1-acyl-sn-glycerol-3-phosphate acyltransferase
VDRLRALVRVPLLLATTMIMGGLWLCVRPFVREPARAIAWRSKIYRAWARASCKLLSLRVEQRGEPPPAPCLLVSNHLGYVDIATLASRADVVFVSKAEVAKWPIVGPFSRAVGTIFVDRASKRAIPEVNARIEAALDRGERVVLFPEGTSSGGDSVLPFKPSLLEAAARSRYRVYCAALRYRTPPGLPPASEVVCWWGDMSFGPHVLRLLRLPSFSVRVEFEAEPVPPSTDRKELAQATWQRVSRLHGTL